MEQIFATPFRTVINPYEKLAQQGETDNSSLEKTLEQILATTQFQTINTKLTGPVDTLAPSDELKNQQEEIQSTAPEDETVTSASSEQKLTSIEEKATSVEEKDSTSIFDKAISIVTDVISSINNALPTITVSEGSSIATDSNVSDEEDDQSQSQIPTNIVETTTIESTITDEKPVSSVVPEDETPVLKSSEEHETGEKDNQEPTSSTGLLEILKSLLPSKLQSTKSDVVSSEEQVLTVENEQQQQQQEIPSPVSGYFTSSDVYHAYKQPVEPVIEDKDVPSIIDGATSIVKSAISSVTNVLPTSKTTEETTSVTASTIRDEQVSAPIVTEEEIIVSKPSEEKEDVDEKQPSSTGLLEIMKSLLPSALRSTKTDVISSEQPISAVEEDQETTSSYISEPSSTTEVAQENLSLSIEPIVESEKQAYVSSPVPDTLSSSSDVDHVYKQSEEPVTEEKDSSGITDKATSIVSNIISSTTSALPTTTRNDEIIVSSDTSSPSEQEAESESEITVEKRTEITEPKISDDEIFPSTVEEKEIIVSKPFEESEKKVEEITQQPSSTGLFEIMKSFIPLASSPKTSVPISVEDHRLVSSSSTIETTTTSKVDEEYPLESTQSIAQIQEQEDISDQASSDTTETDVSDAEKEPTEQVVEEKDSTSAFSKLTSIISDAISAVQHALPTSMTSSTDVHQQNASSEDDEKETSESTVRESILFHIKNCSLFLL
jgi:hypothetical protein